MQRLIRSICSAFLAIAFFLSGALQTKDALSWTEMEILQNKTCTMAERWIPEKPWHYETKIQEGKVYTLAHWERHTMYVLWEEQNGWKPVYVLARTAK